VSEVLFQEPRATVSEPAGRPAQAPRPRHWLPFAIVASLVLASAPCCLWVLHNAHPPAQVHDVALFVHLAALVVGFGGVLAVDWVALLFAAGRRRLSDLLETADTMLVPIWGGYAGLVASGLLLEPDLHSPITQVKLVLVVVIGLNGGLALWLHNHLEHGAGRLPMMIGGLCATISQIGWWGATLVGFLNAH
jgi:hypothetical protein